MIDYDNIQKAYNKMIDDDEQILITLSNKPWSEVEKEYYIQSCDVDNASEGGEIWLAPVEEGIEGSLNEMIVHNDYSVTLSDDFGEEVTEQIIQAILDPKQHIKIRWIESSEPYEGYVFGEKDPDVDYKTYFAQLVREGQESTVKDWTGRYLIFNAETKTHEMKDFK